jgi:hypothetical protein
MSAPEVYFIQFYRREPGDVGISDIPVASDQNYEDTARRALLGYFNNENIVPHQRPHHASVVTHDGFKTLLTMMVTSATTVEIAA